MNEHSAAQAGPSGVGRTIAAGRAAGTPLVLAGPISFWGGFDASTGRVIDTRHPDNGRSLAGRVVLMASAKGSSSSSSVLAEAVRRGTAPAALLMREPDLIIALGSMVASELYGIQLPVVVIDEALWGIVAGTTSPVTVDADGNGVCTLTCE